MNNNDYIGPHERGNAVLVTSPLSRWLFPTVIFLVLRAALSQTPQPPEPATKSKGTPPTPSAKLPSKTTSVLQDYVFEVVAKLGDTIGGKKLLSFRASGGIANGDQSSYPIALNDEGEVAFVACTAFRERINFEDNCDASIFTSKRLVAQGRPVTDKLFISNSGNVAYQSLLAGRNLPTIDGQPVPVSAKTALHVVGAAYNNKLQAAWADWDTFVVDNSGTVLKKNYDQCRGTDLQFNDNGDIGCWCPPPTWTEGDGNTPVCVNAKVVGTGQGPKPRAYLTRAIPTLSLNNRGQIAFRVGNRKIGISGQAATISDSGRQFFLNDNGDVLAESNEDDRSVVSYEVSLAPDYKTHLRFQRWPKGVVGQAGAWAFNNKGQVAVTVFHDTLYVNRPAEREEFLLLGTPRKLGPDLPTMVDPVTIPTASAPLAKVVTTPSDLVKNGRQVVGIAADGVARTVIRIPTLQVGEEVKVEICASKEDLATCGAQNVDEYGLLANLGDIQTDLSNTNRPLKPITSVVVSGVADPYAFVVYRAPLDFTRKAVGATGRPPDPSCPTGYRAEDCKAPSRSVFLHITYADGTQPPPLEVRVVRPPVVLIHGFNTDSSAWDSFAPKLGERYAGEMIRVEYGERLFIDQDITVHGQTIAVPSNPVRDEFTLSSITPEFTSEDGAQVIMVEDALLQSHLGFTFSSPCVALQIRQLLGLAAAPVSRGTFNGKYDSPTCLPSTAPNNLRMQDVSAGGPIAASQIDIVAHSMGGLVARYILSLGETGKLLPSGEPTLTSFPATFGRSLIHKLVTMGTPHLGTGQANSILLQKADCTRRQAARFGHSISAAVIGFKGGSLPGGAAEMAVGSNAISALAPIGIVPTAFLAAIMPKLSDAHEDEDDLPTSWMAATYLLCAPEDPVAKNFTPTSYGKIFDPKRETWIESDGSVPVSSALAQSQGSAIDLTQKPRDDSPYAVFPNHFHSAGINQLLGSSDTATVHLQSGDAEIVNFVSRRLNLPAHGRGYLFQLPAASTAPTGR